MSALRTVRRYIVRELSLIMLRRPIRTKVRNALRTYMCAESVPFLQ